MLRWVAGAMVAVGVAVAVSPGARGRLAGLAGLFRDSGSGPALRPAGAIPTRLAAALLAVSALVAVFVVVRGLVRRFGRRRIRDWHDAERAAAAWLRRVGCRDVTLTGAGADGGVDVVSASCAVQVKHTAKRVGRPAVQQLVGAALTLDLAPVMFATGGFTGPACAYADEHQVALVELTLDGRARPLNRPARRIARRGRWRLPVGVS